MWEPGDPDGVVAVGREFDVDAATPRETWDKVFDICLRGLESAGHKTLKSKRRVAVSPVVKVYRPTRDSPTGVRCPDTFCVVCVSH